MSEHTTELVPCPFCNGTPELRETGGWSGVGCNTNKCPAQLAALMFRSSAEAIAAWNRRSYATALCQQGERDAKDAERYRLLRSKVGMIQTRGIGPASFVFMNMPQPTYIAPDAAVELDAAIDATLSTSEGKTE